MKHYFKPAVITVITVLLVGGIYWSLDKNAPQEERGVDVEKARDLVLEQLNEGIDFSDSLFPDEDEEHIENQLVEQKELIEEKNSVDEQQIYGIAAWYVSAKDYEGALDIYEAADYYGGQDLNYRIRRAFVHRQMGNLDAARAELDLLRTEWPIPDTYLELAEVYKQTPDTPDYVIDDILKEGLEKQVSERSELLLALIEWFEETERPQMAIPYYEEYLSIVHDPGFEQRLIELQSQTN